MKKITCLAILAPGAALAHSGHPELAGSAGHELAHMVLAGGFAVAAAATLVIVRHVLAALRQEE